MRFATRMMCVASEPVMNEVYDPAVSGLTVFLFEHLFSQNHLSRVMRKPDFRLCENKGADQLRSNCEADQRLCFRYSDSTIPLLLIAKISSL